MNLTQEFLKITKILSAKSSCISRKVGSLIVKDNNIIGEGYNDTFNKLCCGEGGCQRCILRKNGLIKSGEFRDECRCIHAEIVAIKDALTSSIGLTDSVLYVSIPPCVPCSDVIYSHGIKKLVTYAPSHIGDGLVRLSNLGIEYELIQEIKKASNFL